ncbi:MAG: pirin family protein [Actinomycetes bacterium]|jgi:redox-sensitive bicupin YhaK (pirin superfamily)
MPAVTADTLVLPRLEPLGPAVVDRPVKSITTAPSGLEGEGFPVRRAFAGIPFADLDPFIMMDQMGEVNYAPYEPRGTDWHPHRGFETVTYIIDGTFLHQDTHGGGGVITDGGTQWMTAGGGILHIETPPEDLVVRGGLFHGFQLWVNLPSRNKMTAPRYQNIEAGLVKLFTSPDASVLVRLIAGDIGPFHGPGSTHTPITVAHASIPAGSQLVLPWRRDNNALVYVLSGHGTVGTARSRIGKGQTAVFGAGDAVTISGEGGDNESTAMMEVIILGGQPIGEPVAHYGPFVMNTREELVQAVEDFQSGRFGRIPADALRPFRG